MSLPYCTRWHGDSKSRTVLRSAFVAFMLLATAIAQPSRAAPPGESKLDDHPPNIVLILADDMGYSDLGCYGGEIDTPHLDSLAEGGLRFTQFYNTARCCPTRASLLTGLYSHAAGIGHMTGDRGVPSYQGYLHDNAATIAEVLHAAGYSTLMTGKWHVGSAKGQWPTDRGFDKYFGTPNGGGVYFKDTLKIRNTVFFAEQDQRVEITDDFYVTDTFTDYALEFVDQAVGQEKPFFLYLAHIAPHWPLQAKPEEIEKYAGRYDQGWDHVRQQRYQRQLELGIVKAEWELSPRHPQAKPWADMPAEKQRELAHRMAVYAAQVSAIDRNVGRLVEKLQQHGQFENTLILFLSDNGCSAEGGPGGFSRGKPGAPIGTGLSYASVGLEWANVSDTPFRQFKTDTYEGGIATPLIAHWPLMIKQRGALNHAPGHVIDLLPTCADLAGTTPLAELHGQRAIVPSGRSLRPALLGESLSREVPLFWEHQGNRAVRQGSWKLVAAHNRPWELYDLEHDRTELHNLAPAGSPAARAMESLGQGQWSLALAGTRAAGEVRSAV